MQIGNNTFIPMTRRQFRLPKKIERRDAKIAKKLANAWDMERDSEKVFSIFLKYKDLLSSHRYWEILRTVWIVCGAIERIDIFKSLMQVERPNRYCFSTPEEIEALEAMSDKFRVYRAYNEPYDKGISWTIDLEYAEGYKLMYAMRYLKSMEVDKKDVFAYINRNNEHEILII